ncbi:MAG: hypothetical protein AAGC68_06415 [Verrucomicrobiota bacterium]
MSRVVGGVSCGGVGGFREGTPGIGAIGISSRSSQSPGATLATEIIKTSDHFFPDQFTT